MLNSTVKKLILFLLLFLRADCVNVAFLIVATGRYIEFVDPLIKSARKYFLTNHSCKFFVFTDSSRTNEPDVEYFFQPRLGWPFDTLKRYHAYWDYKKHYENFDFIYCCDADFLVIDFVGDEILADLVGVKHPGYVGRRGPYERRPLGNAFVRPDEGRFYFAGGFCGGRASKFLKLCRTLKENIDDDYKRGIIATWHDESHLNRYFIDHKPKALEPDYVWPEQWLHQRKAKMLTLLKNHNEIRL